MLARAFGLFSLAAGKDRAWGWPMQSDSSPTEERLLRILREMRHRLGASLVSTSEAANVLDAHPDTVVAAARALESRGLLVCSPSRGPVAMLMLADGAGKPERPPLP